MPFIRQNLFLIVLAAITLVLAAGLLAVNAGVAGDIDQQTKMRQDMGVKLVGLETQARSKILVNQATITELRAHVKAVKDLSDEIAKESEAWNKRFYQVYQYTVGDEKEKHPAFPLDKALLDRNTTSGIASQYVTERALLIAKLSPTWVPDEATINDNIKEVEITEKADQPVPGPGVVPLTDSEIHAKAEAVGASQAIAKKSEGVLVYINQDMAIGQVLPEKELHARPSDLWEAQLQLWILGDIVAAIDQTNQQALSGQGGGDVKRVAVSNAAIKQLVALQIDPRYALGEATDAGSAAGGPRGFGAAPEGPRTPAAGAGADSGIKGDQCLTQRVTTKEYDVKRYTLKLVMATRYLKDFQRYLMQRNYHTILNVSIDKIDPVNSGLGADMSKFNYGPEPVMMVTISGELLLLSGWERALIPNDVLVDWVPKNLR